MSRNDNRLCGLTLYAETCSLKEGHAGPCADGTSERPALLRDRDALAARYRDLEREFRAEHKESAWPEHVPSNCEICALLGLASPSGGGVP